MKARIKVLYNTGWIVNDLAGHCLEDIIGLDGWLICCRQGG